MIHVFYKLLCSFYILAIHTLPDPMISDDGHFYPFDEVFGTSTSEKDLPSGIISKQKKTIPFNATQQHVRNVNLVIQCEECEMWRLLFSKSKLNPQSIKNLESILEEISYTCGASFSDVDMPNDLKSVCIRIHKCFDPVEKLYYSSGFSDVICIYCSKMLSSDDDQSIEAYPQCLNCLSSRPPVKRQKRSRKNS